MPRPARSGLLPRGAGAFGSALVLASAVTVMAEAAGSDRSFAVGVLLPFNSTEAADIRDGASLGLEDASPPGSGKARLVFGGRPGQWGTDGDEAARLTLDEAVDGIITPSEGSASHQILQVAGRTHLPVVSLCPDSSITQAGIPWAVRIVPGTQEEATAILRGLHSERGEGVHRWAALVPPDRAGREIGRDLKAAAGKARCEILEPVRVGNVDLETRAVIARLLADAPDGILLWLEPTGAGQVAADLRAAGFKGSIAGPGRLNTTEFIQRAGAASEGLVIPTIDAGLTPVCQEFERRFRDRFGREPDVLSTMAHDAAFLLIRILQTEEKKRFPVSHLLAGASGLLRFDEQGNRVAPLELMVCRKGKFQRLSDRAPSGVSTLPQTTVPSSNLPFSP